MRCRASGGNATAGRAAGEAPEANEKAAAQGKEKEEEEGNQKKGREEEGGEKKKIVTSKEAEKLGKEWLKQHPKVHSWLWNWTLVAVIVGFAGLMVLLYSEIHACMLWK